MTTSTQLKHNANATKEAVSSFLNQVYLWTVFGLALSAGSAYYVASHPFLLQTILQSGVWWALIIAQLVAVFSFSFLARKQNPRLNTVLYLVYTVLSGTTLSVLALTYSTTSLVNAFLATSAAFLALNIYGRTTKRDLSGLGQFCFIGLIGLIAMYVLSYFVPSLQGNTTQMVLSAIGVLVFAGFTAYDINKIKKVFINQLAANNNASANRAFAITGALNLYLDFINLMLSLLRLGRR